MLGPNPLGSGNTTTSWRIFRSFQRSLCSLHEPPLSIGPRRAAALAAASPDQPPPTTTGDVFFWGSVIAFLRVVARRGWRAHESQKTGRPTGVELTACSRPGNWAHSTSIRDKTEFPAMPVPEPSITRAEFDVLAARTGLPLDQVQKSECYAVFGYLEEIAA